MRQIRILHVPFWLLTKADTPELRPAHTRARWARRTVSEMLHAPSPRAAACYSHKHVLARSARRGRSLAVSASLPGVITHAVSPSARPLPLRILFCDGGCGQGLLMSADWDRQSRSHDRSLGHPGMGGADCSRQAADGSPKTAHGGREALREHVCLPRRAADGLLAPGSRPAIIPTLPHRACARRSDYSAAPCAAWACPWSGESLTALGDRHMGDDKTIKRASTSPTQSLTSARAAGAPGDDDAAVPAGDGGEAGG